MYIPSTNVSLLCFLGLTLTLQLHRHEGLRVNPSCASRSGVNPGFRVYPGSLRNPSVVLFWMRRSPHFILASFSWYSTLNMDYICIYIYVYRYINTYIYSLYVSMIYAWMCMNSISLPAG